VRTDHFMIQIIICLILTGSSPAFDVQTLDGRKISGSLAELTADRLIMKTADGTVTLNAEELLDVSQIRQSANAAVSAGAWIELADGSTIVAKKYTAGDGKAKIVLMNDDLLETPVRAVCNVRLQSESNSFENQWSRILAKKLQSDVLVVQKGDNLEYHQGVLHDINDDVVIFQLGGEDLPVKRSKVYGLIYRHASSETPPAGTYCVTDVFGSHWQVGTIAFGKKLNITTPTGLTLSLLPEMIVKIDFSLGKIAFLSDLKPESTTWTPFFSTSKNLEAMERLFAPRRDRNFDSNPLRLDGTQYEKGLSIHSRTEIIYRLSGSYKRFKAVAGIDDAVRPQGNVRLVIRGDNNILFDTPIAGTDLPKPVDLDISGVRRLSILVDFNGQANIGDHLDLCNARIIK
jgi:hypothetical protein